MLLSVEGERWRVSAGAGHVVMGMGGAFLHLRAGPVLAQVDLREWDGTGSVFRLALLAGAHLWQFHRVRAGPGAALEGTFDLYFGRNVSWTVQASAGGQLLFEEGLHQLNGEVQLATGPKISF